MKNGTPAITRKPRKYILRERWSRNSRSNKPKRQKALWVQAGLGHVPKAPKKFMGHTKEEWDQYMKIKRRLITKCPWCPVASLIESKSRRTRDIHHIRGRAGKLFMDERYMMPVSRWGHEWIAANPDLARQNGWLAPEGKWGKRD